MSTHNICLYKKVARKYTCCNLMTPELLNCALIGVCAVIRSNMVFIHVDEKSALSRAMLSYFQLMRNLLHELLLLAQTEKWSDYYVTNLVNIITDVGMNHLTDSIPDGIRIHLADIYLDELEKVTDEEVILQSFHPIFP